MFGSTENADIINVTLKNAHVEGSGSVGGILGSAHHDGNGRLENLKVSSSVITGGGSSVGGCIGRVWHYTDGYYYATSNISNIVVMGCKITGGENVGGIIGTFSDAPGSPGIDCYVYECMISGIYNVGGIVGSSAFKTDFEIKRCYMSGTIECNGDGTDLSRCAGIVANVSNRYNDKTTICNCRFDGHIIGTSTVAAGIIAYAAKGSASTLNIVSGSIHGSKTVMGIGSGSGNSCVCCADTIYSTGGTSVRIGPNTNGYAYNGMAVYSKNQKVEVEDGGEQGIGYSLRVLKKKNTYIGLSYDFDDVWSIEEDRTFPYLKAQSVPPSITSCVGGENGIVTGTASGNGTIYVFVGGKMYEGEVIGGQWSVPVAEMPEGAVVNVYAETDGMKPSCKISAISEPKASFVELDENSTIVPEAATDVDVCVRRTIKANEWSTICLPFTATGEQVKQAWGEDVQLASFTGWESEEDADGAIVAINVMFSSANVNEGIAANTPMLIKVSRATETATFDGVSIEPEEAPVVQVGRKASERGYFYGTYTMTTVPEENLFLSGNKFWYSTGATSIKGYRGYFELRDVLDAYYDGSEVKVNVFIDDEATGIRTLSDSPLKSEDTYNLAGQRVGRNYKGVVVTKGKKIL